MMLWFSSAQKISLATTLIVMVSIQVWGNTYAAKSGVEASNKVWSRGE